MPRPRFAKLAPERREAILDAAAAEFGEHGFSRASYNQIIERAGLSKGAMYYYFADKQDLYATVMDEAVTRVFEVLTPMPDGVQNADEFWTGLEQFVAQLYAQVIQVPRMMMLLPALLNPRPAAEDMEVLATIQEQAGGWVREIMARGRGVGAVRDDIPEELLLDATMAVGQVVDRWVAVAWTQQRERGEKLSVPTPEVIHYVVDLMRRVAEPRP